MVHVVKLTLFAMVVIAGFYVIPLFTNLAVMMNVFPELPEGKVYDSFFFWLYEAGPMLWLACAIASIGYFFTRGELRIWLLLAPMYVTAVYSILVMTYFNFVRVT